MNILLATHNFLPYHLGGTEIYVKNLAFFLIAKGYNPTIISAIDPIYFDINLIVYDDDNLKICKYSYENITVFGVVYKTITTKQIYSKHSAEHVQSFCLFFHESHFDLLHINGFTSTIGLDLIFSMKEINPNLKLITSYHTAISDPKETLTFGNKFKEKPQDINHVADSISYRFNLPYWFASILSFFLPNHYLNYLPAIFNLKYLTKLHLKAFDRLVFETNEWWVYSLGIKNMLLNFGIKEDRIKFQRHGISPIFERKNLANNNYKFLFNGRLLKIKGFHTLLKAWLELDENLDKELWITGFPKTNEKSTLKILKKAIKRKDIKWLGNLSQEQLSEIYPLVHTVIVPSECYEIGPLVLHEAIASGCNVIASDIGGCKELTIYYQNSISSFKTGDVKDLSYKIMSHFFTRKSKPNRRTLLFNDHFESMTQKSDIYS